MYGHGHPYYAPPPPPPPRSGLSPLAIALIVIGSVTVLGGGACVVLGGLVYLGANAEAEAEGPAADPFDPGASTANPSTSSTLSEPPPLRPLADEDTGDDGLAGADDDHGDEGDDSALADPSAAGEGASSGGASPSPPKSAGTRWSCNATGSVRVCGFANVCNYQMVSGIGWGADRYFAQTMAKNACENMARAKGGSTVCAVTCSPKVG